MNLELPVTPFCKTVYIIYDLCNNLYSKIKLDLFFIDNIATDKVEYKGAVCLVL